MNRFSKLIIVGFVLLLNQAVFSGRGPSQPEAAKFEPIDATDLVSLYTGNFTYNLPLLEVMGPEGGFPINIFYHAGIGPNTEASWIGLGWDLNAGSINRFVNGYPDDYFGGYIRSHYNAEKQKGKGVYFGVSYGPVGVNISYDCYTGQTGVNASYNIMNGSLDFLSFADKSLGLGFNTSIHVGTSGVGISASLGASLNNYNNGYNQEIFLGVSASMIGSNSSTSYNFSYSGFSISSGSGGTNISVAGVGFGIQTQTKLDSKGNFSSSEWGVSLPVGMAFGIPLSISFGGYEWEWWLDEVDNEIAVGSLHQLAYTGLYQLSDIWGSYSNNVIDKAVIYGDNLSYASTEQGLERAFRDPKIDRNLVTNSNSTIGNLIFTAEDNYQVGVQGLAGSFKPYYEYTAKYYDNTGENGTGNYSIVYATGYTVWPFNTGEHTRFRFDGDLGGNFVNLDNPITNYETIMNNYGGKIVKPAIDLESGTLLGFEITVKDGKIYEFYQPIYSYYSQSYKKQTSNGNITSETIMSTPYATSWLITGIKGPDYIDRGQSGYTADDWGYWVKFRYATSENFVPWRTPQSGTSGSIDPVFQNYETKSEGLRENVYLESIETATHIAKFNKLDRLDDKSPSIDNPKLGAMKWNGTESIEITFPFDKSKFGSIDISNVTLKAFYDCMYFYPNIPVYDYEVTLPNINLNNFSDNIQDNKFTIIANLNNYIYVISGNKTGGYIDAINLEINSIPSTSFYEKSKKLDKVTLHKKVLLNDGSYKTDYTASYANPTIEGCKFDYSYELMKNAPNNEAGKGKLTLKAVSKIGKNGAENLIPPTEFSYGFNPDWSEHCWDIWGGYTSEGTQYNHMNSMIKSTADRDAGAWCLNKIILPTGGVTTIEYESDFIDKIGGDTENKLALFTTWFCQGAGSCTYMQNCSYPVQPETNAVNYFYITDPDVDSPNRIPFSEFEEIFNQYESAFDKPMPAAISYYDGVSNDLEVGKQNAVHITSLTPSQNKVNFNELLHFNVSDNYRAYNIQGVDPYTGQDINIFCLPDLFTISPNFMYGGGNRVKSVSVSDISTTKRTNYKYKNGYLTVMPSLAYTFPKWLVRCGHFTTAAGSGTPFHRDQTALANYNYNILGPSPMVGYDRVEVFETDENGTILNGKSVHEFYTAEDYPFNPEQPTSPELKIIDHSNMQGRPKYSTIYKMKPGTAGLSDEDYLPIQSIVYSYLNSTEIAENLNNYKVYSGLSTQLNQYQPVGLSQRVYQSKFEDKDVYTIDYENEGTFIAGITLNKNFYDETELVNIGNVSYITENIGFIAQTGGVGISQTYTSTGEKVVTENLPAFWFYPDMKSKNMLTQNAETKSYRLPSGTNFLNLKTANTHNNYLVSADVTTWKDWSSSEDLWRINDTYKWIGEASSFQEFNLWTTDDPGDKVLNDNWQRSSNLNAYDRYAHPIEELALDGEYVTSIYSYNEALPVAVISNARRSLTDIGSEVSYCGFESGTNQYSIETSEKSNFLFFSNSFSRKNY